ncbi:ubiquitin carboxyl-terminal hydrolase-domain-containing protein [Chlamydoabsidia padenii]|nr:ubiquitin carboxyl-terminal hydrolase-domain-containing protein [Chlamydoabsidia padenii]
MGSFAPTSHFYQVQTSSYITAMDISSSGQTLVFGDGNSFVHQYADRDNYVMNPYSIPVTIPDTAPPPNVLVNNDTPLSAIGMPYYTEPLLSSWTNRSVYDIGHPSPQIDDDILKSIKTIDFVGYAPNPGTIHRNQIPRRKKQAHKKDIPKFRSEQERELLSASHSGRRSSSVGDVLLDLQGIVMPKHYHHVEIQYSKFGVDDFDFGYYNRTLYGGLETNIRNSYCNSLLQVLYFILPLRQIAKCHICTSCDKENCLMCELGFLFRMLEDSNGQNCQATNFLKAFSTIPQAAALGLFEPESPTRNVSYSMLMQNFVRFILEQLHQETNTPANNPIILTTLKSSLAETTATTAASDDSADTVSTNKMDDTSNSNIPSLMQQLFGLQTLTQSKCGSCNNETSRITYPFAVDLLYPKKSTTTKKIIQGLPGVLLINSGAYSSEEASIWRQNGPSSPKARTDSPNQEGDSPSESVSSSWLPERFGILINGSEMTIKLLPHGKDIPPEFVGPPETCAIYELSSTVLQVQAEEEAAHLVAQVKIPDCERMTYTSATGLDEEEKAKSPWYIFNDFLIKRIRPEEITSFKGLWKTPAVIQYTRVDIDSLLDLDTLSSEVDYSLLFKKMSIAENTPEKTSYEILTKDEMPTPGTLIAIDSEFVALRQEETEIRSDGTKSLIRPSTLSLARLSVTRGGDGDKEDDYIVTSEPVVDYLTEFSGIEADDLNPETSRRTLVPLKVAYKKIRLLVDLGCVFIGHGLKKDFRIINILVPPDQIIDTVDIYHIRNRHRKISLRFLAWHLLGQEIQSEGHDSIIDAKTALILYKKYLEYRDNGTFGQVLEGVYAAGHKSNWLKAPKDTPSTVPNTPKVEQQHSYFTPGWAL